MNTMIAICSAVAALASSALAGPVEEMLDTDRAFAEMATKDGAPAAFAHYAAEDVRMFPAGGAPYQGRERLIADFAGWPEGATLSWTPQEGVAAAGGDFGFTWGFYEFRGPSADASPSYGKYVSIWRKGADGAWKFVADIGNAGPSPDAADTQ